jgi:hypothetical protein
MCKYLSSIIADFPKQITGVSATPAAGHLFKVREEVKIEQRTGGCIPPYSVSTAVCSKQSSPRYSDSGVLLNYTSTSP